jgi:predicted dehydrogenase
MERMKFNMENKVIRVAMIGFGGIAKSHKRGYEILAKEGAPVKLVAICDINPEQFTKAQAINIEGKSKYDLSEQTLYTDLDEMIAKEDFEMVDICLPSFLHKEYATRMLRAGKHVLCEKPMSLSSADCEEMIATAHECGKKLMIGQCLRFEPLYLVLKNAIEQGTFGKVKNAFFDRLSRFLGLHDGKTDVDGVSVENAGKALGDNQRNAAFLDGDGRMLSGGAATEVPAANHDVPFVYS